MRKSRKWREKRGERKKSPLIMRGPTRWVPIKKENKITKSMDDSYILVQDDEEERTINDTNRIVILNNIQNLSSIVSH